MSKADGSVVINTKLNTGGFGDSAKDLKTQFKSLASSASKISGAVVAAFGVAVVGITKEVVKAYADYEQLIGGIETLYGNATAKVAAAAENAFYTVNMSANEYMETITSFSASLISSLGGDTEKAAEVADMALQDMADNANKMGSSLESIKTAYQGFAKQQYMLLDNLKLGYGGTKTEMERLLKDAEKLTGQKYDIENLADVYNAIHAIQVEIGVAGATADEAEKTITGSANMTKAAWKNVLKALGGGGDLEIAINNLVFSITKLFDNVMPVVERALSGIGQMIEQAAPALVETIAAALIKAIPSLLNAIYNMILGLAKGIYNGIVSLFSGTTKEIEKQLTATNGIADNNSKAADSAEKLADETEKAGKAAKKALAGFDELNILTSAKSEEETDLGISGGTGGADSGGQSNWDIATQNVAQASAEITAIMSGALLLLGAILTFTGANIPLGLGLLAVGAIGLADVATENWGAISEALRGPIGEIVNILSTSLLVLGAILAFSGAGIGLGIGLMIAGALGLAAVYSANWDSMVGPISDTISTIMVILGGAMLVIGIILCLTGAGLGLGLALIMTGLAGTITAASMGDNPLTNFVKGLVNGILGLINMLIEAINSLFHIKFDGLNIAGVQIIPKLDFRLLKIPPIPFLAKGAVIPPNAPFMAMLGDQRHGTNIEAPLSTIQDAVRAELGATEDAIIAAAEAVIERQERILSAIEGIEIGDTTIGQAAARYNRKMSIITGGT